MVKLKINGTEVSVNTKKVSFINFGYDFEGSETLIYYDNVNDCVMADERADESYIKYAALHEAICMGKYKDLAPKCSNPNCRCFEIDKMIIGIMPENERKSYITKRITMFENLLEKEINPPMNDLFRESLNGLKEM